MTRVIAAGALILALSACKSSPSSPPPGETIVRPWTEISVPGVEIFTTHLANPPADYDNRGAYLQHAVSATKISGKEAMRVVVAKGIQDPAQLATFSQLFLDSIGGRIVNRPEEAAGDPAAPRVAPPAVKDGVLEYWHWTGGMAHMIQRSRVNLTTFERETKTAHELEIDEDPLGVARRQLGSGSSSMEQAGVDLAIRNCPLAGASALLTETLRTHPRAATRAHVAWWIRNCHDESSIAALIGALEADPDGEVRWKAADTLGELRASAARAALTKAADDADENVKHAAQRALKKLDEPEK